MKHKINFTIICLTIIFFFSSCISSSKTISIELFNLKPDTGQDASYAVRSALEFCKSNKITKLTFPPGRYDFYTDYTYEKYMYISNNNDGIKNIVFLIEKMKDFEIDGQGSEFVFHGYICPMVLSNSSNIKISNLTIDYARTFHSEGLLVGVGENYIDVAFGDEYPYQIENERLKFYDHEKQKGEYPFGNLLEFDILKKEPAFKVNDYYIGNNIKVNKTTAGNVRLYINGIKATKGNIMVFAPNHRNCPGITINKSKQIQLNDIKLYHSGGMGIIAQLSSDIYINQIECTLPAFKNRIVSCTADATHFSNCYGNISITNSLFENQMDDATNVHGIFMRIEEVLNSKSVLLKLVHHEQLGMEIFSIGDLLEFVDANTLFTYGYNKIKAIENINKDLTIIEFAEDLPKNTKVNDVVGSNLFANILFKGNTVRNNRARGLLLGSKNQILIEDNFFHTPGSAVLTGGDAKYWFEQGGVKNLTIKNNVFDNCLYGIWGQAVIQIDAGADTFNEETFFFNKNIKIINNKFRTFDPRIVKAQSTDGLIFKDNKLTDSEEYPQQNIKIKPFVITSSRNVDIDTEQYFTYQNPLDFSYTYFNGKEDIKITELRDPCIMRDGDTYYLVFTHYPFTHHTSRDSNLPDMNSSPGIRLYSSKDLKNWKFVDWIVKSGDLPDDCPYKHRFWAPEIRKMNGKYYVIFYADNWLKNEYNCTGEMGYVGFVGVSEKPEGPYEHITWLEGSGCDTHLFADSDGSIYAVMPFGDTFIQKADLNRIDQGQIQLIGNRKKIVNRNNSDINESYSPSYMEAPWMIKIDNNYVLFTGSPYQKEDQSIYSDLKPGYWVGVSMSKNIWGPYDKQAQLFLGGHIAVFKGPDGKEWFSYRGESGGQQHGKLCIDPIPFQNDGSLNPFEPSINLQVIPKAP